jgi:uncharacterized membrane protein YoaK (UPF0700 family)
MTSAVMTRLLSLNAGFVDTVGFLGLQGLFTAHVTGNFVTLAAGFVYGPHGTIGKLLALPEFIGAVAVTRLVGAALTARGLPTFGLQLQRRCARRRYVVSHGRISMRPTRCSS